MRSKRLIALLLAAMTVVLLIGCSKKKEEKQEEKPKQESSEVEEQEPEEESSEPDDETSSAAKTAQEIEGTEQEWGDFTVFVPSTAEFIGGDFFDETDTRYFSIKESEFKYMDFSREEKEEDALSSLNYNKSLYTNGQEDAEVTYNGKTWTGFTYDAMGFPAFELYTQIDDAFVRVASVGYDINGPMAEKVLGSVKVAMG